MKLLLSLVCFVLCLSCKKQGGNADSHYSKDKIIAVMTDLYIAQAAIKDVDPSYTDSLISNYKKQIEIIHKVDMALIEEDIAALQRQPQKYQELHSTVEDSIVIIEKRYNKKKEINIGKSK